MKIVRSVVLLICFVMISSVIWGAAAVGISPAPTLEQYASQLSLYTDQDIFDPDNTSRYIAYKIRYPDYSWDTVITYVNIGLDTNYYTNVIESSNPERVNVLVNKYHSLPSDFVPNDLEVINHAYCFQTMSLTHNACVAFENMCADARALGYSLYATSAYRSYARQATIYKTVGIPDVTTARPGFSEHQTGLAVDVIHGPYASNKYLTSSAVYRWYAQSAYQYGFIIHYPSNSTPITGYTPEPWHLRYLGVELATAVYNSGLTYDEYYARYIDVSVKGDLVTAVGVTAQSPVATGGTVLNLSALRVLGDTYYKLRDIAVVLNGTPLQFDVTWDADTRSISLLSGNTYTSDLTLGAFESGQVINVSATSSALYADGTLYDLSAFMLGGSNYFKLEDIASMLGFTAETNGTAVSITASGITAQSPISVNGTTRSLSAMNILGETYYKLRDIAFILNGTPLQFDVAWDADTRSISLLSGTAYASEIPLGAFEPDQIINAAATSPTLYADGTLYGLGAFMLDGSNYFKLEDIASMLAYTLETDNTGVTTLTANP